MTIDMLLASTIASGTLADHANPTTLELLMMQDLRHSVTQHVDLTNLNASNLTSGTVPDAELVQVVLLLNM